MLFLSSRAQIFECEKTHHWKHPKLLSELLPVLSKVKHVLVPRLNITFFYTYMTSKTWLFYLHLFELIWFNNQFVFLEIKLPSKISDVFFDDKVVTKGDNTTKFKVALNYS